MAVLYTFQNVYKRGDIKLVPLITTTTKDTQFSLILQTLTKHPQDTSHRTALRGTKVTCVLSVQGANSPIGELTYSGETMWWVWLLTPRVCVCDTRQDNEVLILTENWGPLWRKAR